MKNSQQKSRLNKLGLILLFIVIYSCNIKESKLFGKYINASEPGVTHYVELKADSTFEHFYKTADTTIISKGEWRYRIKDSGEQIITFLTWNSLGKHKGEQCKNCSWAVEVKDDELIFSYDSPEMNFNK